MKRILFTWELGGGLGHIIPIRLLAKQYLAMGNEVYIAMKDLTHAASVFTGMKVKFLQSPFKSGFRSKPIIPALCFSHMMNNNGFENAADLEGLVRSWKTMFELVRPDVICFDYSPSALVAARDYDCVKVTIGVGFSSPPPGSPFGVFTEMTKDIEKLEMDDQLILDNTNIVLEKIGSNVLSSLDQLFYEDIKTCFLSLPEFDHFFARDKSLYYGPILLRSGLKPIWPKKYKKKVYVYVKQFAGIARLFHLFAKFHIAFIVYTNDVPHDIINSCLAPNISFLSDPLDLLQVSKEADLAIVNAGHTTLCQFVLAGVPVLMVPLQMEQQMLALRLDKQKAGWIGDIESHQFFQNVETLLGNVKKGLSIQCDIHNKYSRSNFHKKQIEMCNDIVEFV